MKRFVFTSLLLCLLLLFGGCARALPSRSAASDLSPAFGLLRERTRLTRAGSRYEDLTFSRADFLSLTGEDTEYIVINSLPDSKAGLLMLNGKAVLSGQTVPASSLDYLKFIPCDGDATEAVFHYTAKAPGWENRELTVELTLSEQANYPPVLSETSLTAETYTSVACFATLSACDPNGDEITYEILRYPRHGSLRLNGNELRYTPKDGFAGEDAVTFRVRDRFGGVSQEGKVTFSVQKSPGGLYFTDLTGSPVHNAAIRLCDKQIMTYRKEADGYYFDPELPVSKIDCLVMMMCLCGRATDQTVSAGKDGFLQEAIATGSVYLGDGDFCPDAPVTAADAAYMATALLGVPTLSAKQEFFDYDATPAWACAALVSADSSGILAAKNGLLDAGALLDRADVAELLDRMARYCKAA